MATIGDNLPALYSANRAPTRSECLMNFSVQFRTHVSCFNKNVQKPQENVLQFERATSLEESALLVKSLQHVLKHFSARLAYIRRKSCI